jgi:hypothetical protein
MLRQGIRHVPGPERRLYVSALAAGYGLRNDWRFLHVTGIRVRDHRARAQGHRTGIGGSDNAGDRRLIPICVCNSLNSRNILPNIVNSKLINSL